MNSLQAIQNTQLKNDTFRLVSKLRLQTSRFHKLQEALWLTVINEIFKFPLHFNVFGYENYLDELSLG